MPTDKDKNLSIDYPALISDIRHELEKVYHYNMHPPLVLDAIDILIHEQTGLACVSDTSQRQTSANGSTPTEVRKTQ